MIVKMLAGTTSFSVQEILESKIKHNQTADGKQIGKAYLEISDTVKKQVRLSNLCIYHSVKTLKA